MDMSGDHQIESDIHGSFTGRALRGLGGTVLRHASFSGQLANFLFQTLRSGLSPPFFLRETIKQIKTIGVESFPLVAIVALSSGLVMSMNALPILADFGAKNEVATFLGLSIPRELGPVFTALMVAARAGAGMTAELGSMKVTRQIDALRVSAVNPLRFLAFTRILATVIAMPLLTILADAIGIVGGMIIASTQGGVEPPLFLSIIAREVSISDIFPGLIKAVLFGFAVGSIACYMGFSTRGGTEGVGRATTASVVVSCFAIMILDVIITPIMIRLFPI